MVCFLEVFVPIRQDSRFYKNQLRVITHDFDSFKWLIYKQILISQFCFCSLIHIQQQQFKYPMFDLYIYVVLDSYNYA